METAVPGHGASHAMERRTGQGREGPTKRHRTVFLLRRPGARGSRRPDRAAAPLARERLCLRATTDYWVNAMDGQPFLYINKEVDPGLIATLKQDVIPWLETS